MFRRRGGRPGLVGTMARTAVIAGTASAVSGNVQRNAAERAAASPPDEKTTKIRELGQLHADGLLSDEEFSAAKASLLGI